MFRSPQSLPSPAATVGDNTSSHSTPQLQGSIPPMSCGRANPAVPKAVGVFCGHRAYSSAGKNPTASAHLLLQSTQHTTHNAQALLTSENVALPIFSRFENILQSVSQSTSYRNKNGARRKCSDLLKLKEQGASELGNEISWPTTPGFSFLNKDSLSSLKN